MPQTIIAHLYAKIEAIDNELDAIDAQPVQMAADGQTSIAWSDGCIRHTNALSDSQDALMESISRRPPGDLGDTVIQLRIAARIMRIVNGSKSE